MIDTLVIFLLVSLPCAGFVCGCYWTKARMAARAEQVFEDNLPTGFVVFVPSTKKDTEN